MFLTSEITVRLIQKVGGDHCDVAAARTSTSGEEALKWLDEPPEENFGLINYLLAHRHGSPVEHSFLTFFIEAPIFVFREWHRHRIGWSYSEMSARYRALAPKFWVPRRNRPMVPGPAHKSARPSFITLDEAVRARHPEYSEVDVKNEADLWYAREMGRTEETYRVAWKNYEESIQDGISLEVARSKLPVGIYSAMWASCNPRSLMHFLSLRTHDTIARYVSYPQLEIEEAARVCEDVFREGWPLTWRAWNDNGRVSP